MDLRLKAYAITGVSASLYIPVKFSKLPANAWGVLVDNQVVFIEESLPDDEKLFTYCHELLHLLLEHIERGKGRHPDIWNIAADHVVNTILFDLGLRSKHAIILKDMPDGPVEVIYRMLHQAYSNALACGRSTFNFGGHKFQIVPSGDVLVDGKPAPNHGTGKVDAPGAKHEFEQTVKSRGSIPSELAREFERASRTAPWERVLFSRIASSFGLRKQTFTYTRLPFYGRAILNRRGVRIPGYIGRDLRLVVAVDTSGSISRAELSVFMANVEKIRKLVSDLWVIVCDASIHEVYHNPPDCTRLKVSGGGGTDFRPVFKFIEDHKIAPKLLLFFTDTYGTFPSLQPPYPVQWVVVETPATQKLSVPFGEVLYI